jgi:hypothetical protein
MESELGKLAVSVRKGIEVLAEQMAKGMDSRKYTEEEEAVAGMLR